MNVILLGPQGSGKGTQAKLLVEKYGFFYISAGDMLRNIAKTNPEIEQIIKSGKLIPDQQTFHFITQHLAENRITDNILFDGYPRSAEQFELFKENNIKIDHVFILRISDEESIRRLSGRRMHRVTGEIYNIITNPPPADVNPDDLVQREDDQPEAIKQRLEIFHTVTDKLISDLERSGISYAEINAERPIGEIFSDLSKILDEKGVVNVHN